MIREIWGRFHQDHQRRTAQSMKLPDCVFEDPASFNPATEYEGGNRICSGVEFTGKIGYGSYLGPHTSLPQTCIGRYCSIAQNVLLAAGRHPTERFVSTHPAFFSTAQQAGFTYTEEQKFEEYRYADQQKHYYLIIGNDVWIGANVTILDGITIGDGAIIGAGSVVTKDVSPYAIVGGVPAKTIRYRFSEEEIEFLLGFQWWNKGQKWIKENANLFENIRWLQTENK